MLDKKKKTKRVKEKRNLSILNCGDTVVIKNRSAIAGGVMGSVILGFMAVVMFILREAWDEALFWGVFAFVVLSTAYMLANALFGKIVLNSPERLMIVYFPFKIEYKFSDINYIDIRSSKPKDGIITHRVSILMGKGKSSVDITTTSLSQAQELSALLRGMLDNGAMEYPEGNEEPFVYDGEKPKKRLSVFNKKKKTDEPVRDDAVEFSPIKKAKDEQTNDVAAADEMADNTEGQKIEAELLNSTSDSTTDK